MSTGLFLLVPGILEPSILIENHLKPISIYCRLAFIIRIIVKYMTTESCKFTYGTHQTTGLLLKCFLAS